MTEYSEKEEPRGPIRILVGEDDSIIAHVVQKKLRREGFETDEATTGLEILGKASGGNYDLLLLDYRLPDLDGGEVIDLLSQNGIEIPFIIMTGFGDEAIAVDMMKLGAQDYLIKDPKLFGLLPKVINRSLKSIEGQKRLLAATAKIQEQASLLDGAQDSIMVLDENYEITYWNKASERIYGFKEDEVKGRMESDFLLPSKAERDKLKGINELLVEKGKWQGEIEHADKDGTAVIVSSHRSMVYDQENQPKSVLIINTDISEKKSLQKQIILSQKMESVGQMAGGIAHDFNNILAGIFGYVRLAQRGLPEDSPARKDLEQVMRGAKRAKTLVSQILSFSSHNTAELRSVVLADVVEEAIHLLNVSATSSVLIEKNIEDVDGFVMADSTQIHQVIINLGMNSLHAMKERGGKLRIGLQRFNQEDGIAGALLDFDAGDYIVLKIQDEGHGMDEETVSRIFDPFFTTKGEGEGSGIGLAVVHGIVTHHGGKIEVRSDVGEGTITTIYFPLAKDVSHLGSLVEGNDSLLRGDERILLIDDQQSALDPVEQLLGDLGYTVEAFTKGELAVNRFAEDPAGFDLVITDQKMPGMSGIELSQQVLAIKPGVPVIITTGFSTTLSRNKAQLMGISEIVMKPYSYEEISQTIRRVLVVDESLEGEG